MHSNKLSPYLPTYGNKVIGVRFGVLEMHGVPRPITWTRMSQTANAGATSI
jgi:G8 domain